MSDLRREVKRDQARGISPLWQVSRRKQPLTECYGLFGLVFSQVDQKAVLRCNCNVIKNII